MGNYVAPIQPFTGAFAQENFGQMQDHVLSFSPKIPTQVVKRRINVHLRALQQQRMWAGLMVHGSIYCPALYDTGTITSTPESDIVQGTATSWPVSDVVNTTLSTAITVANELQDVTPASMSGINFGDWLLFDDGQGTEEFVLVHSITSTTFKARPTQVHSSGATITRSSLAERQLRVGGDREYHTVIGITTDQRMKLDDRWNHAAKTLASYQVIKAYVTMAPGLKIVWSIVNSNQSWEMTAYIPQDVVQRFDPGRSAQGDPHLLVNFTPDHIGRIRYELYPAPTTEQGLPYLAAKYVPDLSDDEDVPPTCIPSHVLVNFALADCLLYDRKSEYYDPRASAEFRAQAREHLVDAIRSDDAIAMQDLQWIISQYNLCSPGGNYNQTHDIDTFW